MVLQLFFWRLNAIWLSLGKFEGLSLVNELKSLDGKGWFYEK